MQGIKITFTEAQVAWLVANFADTKNDESLIDSNNKWSVHVYNEDMQTIGYFELTYVHQLQHALRLCGIEKEIEI